MLADSKINKIVIVAFSWSFILFIYIQPILSCVMYFHIKDLPSCAFPSGCPTNPTNTVPSNKTNKNIIKNCICRKYLIYYSTHCHMRVKSDSKTLFQESITETFSRQRALIFLPSPIPPNPVHFSKNTVRGQEENCICLPTLSLSKCERDSIVRSAVARN